MTLVWIFTHDGNIKIRWPLLRDLTFYSLGLVVLILFFIDNYVRIWEAALLVLLYVLYFITLVLNKKIKGLFAKKSNTADGDQVKEHEYYIGYFPYSYPFNIQ